MKEIIITFVFIFILFSCILLGLHAFIWGKENNARQRYMEEFSSYTIININGMDYETDNIKSVEVECIPHCPDKIVIELKDDTIILFSGDNYTLKDKK